MRFGVQMALVWIMTPCSLVDGYEHFEEACRLQSQVKGKKGKAISVTDREGP
jgi:hypothetical protein